MSTDTKYTVCLSCGRIVCTYYGLPSSFPDHDHLSGENDKSRCECGGKLTKSNDIDVCFAARRIIEDINYKLPVCERAEEKYRNARVILQDAEADLYEVAEDIAEQRRRLSCLEKTGLLSEEEENE